MNWLGLTNVKEFDIKSPTCPILSLGMSEPESWGRWTSENNVKLIIPRDPTYDGDVAIIIELMAHTHGKALESQNVTIFHGGRVISEWNIPDKWYRLKGLLIPFSALSTDEHIELDLEIPDAESPKKFGGSDDDRKLGIGINRIWVGNINDPANVSSTLNIIGSRYVGTESRKTWDHKHLTGFWKSYITGPKVLDVGFSSYGDPRVVPIMEDAIGVDIDYPGYDGKYLPFGDCSQDAVYSSHCLEHIPDHLGIIQDWHRVTKVGGHIIIAVPSRDLFERRRRPPSSWNTEHLRMYTCASLLAEIEAALAPNTFKIRHLSENDDLFDYNLNPTMPPYGNYEITAVIEKIEAPEWRLVE